MCRVHACKYSTVKAIVHVCITALDVSYCISMYGSNAFNVMFSKQELKVSQWHRAKCSH